MSRIVVVGCAGVSATSKPRNPPPAAAVAMASDTPDVAVAAASALAVRMVAVIVMEAAAIVSVIWSTLTPAAEASWAV